MCVLSHALLWQPFLIGIHSSHLDELLSPDSELSEVVVVDLDAGELHVAGARRGGGAVIRDIVRLGALIEQTLTALA